MLDESFNVYKKSPNVKSFWAVSASADYGTPELTLDYLFSLRQIMQ